MSEIKYSLGRNFEDNKPQQKSAANFNSFAQAVLSQVSDQKGQSYFCAPMLDGLSDNPKNIGTAHWRGMEGSLPRRFLALDLDGLRDQAAFKEFTAYLYRWTCFWYTTASSESFEKGNEGRPRMRVVLELSREVSRSEGLRLGKAVQKQIDLDLPGCMVGWDASTHRAEQPSYTPVKISIIGSPFQGNVIGEWDSAPLNVDSVLASEPPVGTEASGTARQREMDTMASDPVVRALEAVGKIKSRKGAGAYNVECPYSNEHTSESSETSTVYYLPNYAGVKYGKFHCLHDHCNNHNGSGEHRPQEDYLIALGLNPKAVWYEQKNPSSVYLTEFDDAAESSSIWFSYANMYNLSDDPPPPREWCVKEWLPLGSVTALFAPGGTGKSLLAQQLATHVAAGIRIFGQDVASGPAIAYLCEDDCDELRRRQQGIVNALPELHDGLPPGLFIEGRAGKDNTLLTFGKDGLSNQTKLLKKIDQECERIKPKLLVIDNIAQVYAGQENDRHQVTVFCNELTGLAQKHNCAVLLLGHTAKAEGSEYSGSTAWEAAVRTRLFLGRSKDDGTLELRKSKSNYSSLDTCRLEYQHGYLAGIDAPSLGTPDSYSIEKAKVFVLTAITVLSNLQISTSNSPQARSYLPKLMVKQNMLGGNTLPVVERALVSLVIAGAVLPNSALGWKNASRHQAMGLIIANPEAQISRFGMSDLEWEEALV